MKTILKYHKSIVSLLALMVPGAPAVIDMLEKSGVDWSALVAGLASSNPKIWALAGVVALLPYLQHKVHAPQSEIDELRNMVAELMERDEGGKS
jgi:hypothetical protein